MTAKAEVETRAGKYLTFKISTEEYGVEILKVQEIIGIMTVTKIPKTPEFIRGVINLRGKVIPVVDLRLKFGLEAIDDSETTCVIVVQIRKADQTLTTGIIVDEVYEVVDINNEQIEDAPSFGASVETDFILGMGKVAEKVISLLDIDKVFSENEISALNKKQ